MAQGHLYRNACIQVGKRRRLAEVIGNSACLSLKTRIPTDRMTCREGKFTRWGACRYDSKFALVAQGGLQLIWLLPKLENHECGMVVSKLCRSCIRPEGWLARGWNVVVEWMENGCGAVLLWLRSSWTDEGERRTRKRADEEKSRREEKSAAKLPRPVVATGFLPVVSRGGRPRRSSPSTRRS